MTIGHFVWFNKIQGIGLRKIWRSEANIGSFIHTLDSITFGHSPFLLFHMPHHKNNCFSVLQELLIFPSKGLVPCTLHFENIQDTRTWHVLKKRKFMRMNWNTWNIWLPVSGCYKIRTIFCKANCLHFSRHFVTCNLGNLSFIGILCCQDIAE